MAYNACTGANFDVPGHPGDAPHHVVNATVAQITEANRQFNQDLANHTLYRNVHEELRKHVLTTVLPIYLAILEDVTFGYVDVTCLIMLSHTPS